MIKNLYITNIPKDETKFRKVLDILGDTWEECEIDVWLESENHYIFFNEEEGFYMHYDVRLLPDDLTEITYEEFMRKYDVAKGLGSTIKDLDEIEIVEKKEIQEGYLKVPKPNNPTGGSSNYYDLPKNAKTLQDLIEFKNMNAQQKDIFKACWRMGSKEGTKEEYDVRKQVYYSLRELGRLLGTKNYMKLAKDIIGEQSEED